MIESAGGAQNAIFQIQLALAALWPLRQRGWLTNKHLDDMGHVGGIVQSHIVRVLAGLTPEQKLAAEVLFKSLAMLDSTLKLVQAPQFWQALSSVPAIADVDGVMLRDTLATSA